MFNCPRNRVNLLFSTDNARWLAGALAAGEAPDFLLALSPATFSEERYAATYLRAISRLVFGQDVPPDGGAPHDWSFIPRSQAGGGSGGGVGAAFSAEADRGRGGKAPVVAFPGSAAEPPVGEGAPAVVGEEEEEEEGAAAATGPDLEAGGPGAVELAARAGV
jgi:hypothetical protein